MVSIQDYPAALHVDASMLAVGSESTAAGLAWFPFIETSAKSGAASKGAGTSRPKEPIAVKTSPKAAPILSLASTPKPAVVRDNGSRLLGLF